MYWYEAPLKKVCDFSKSIFLKSWLLWNIDFHTDDHKKH